MFAGSSTWSTRRVPSVHKTLLGLVAVISFSGPSIITGKPLLASNESVERDE